VFVTFLDLRPKASAAVEGVLLPVNDDDLRVLDARERNYHRVLVPADRFDPAPDGDVWVYVGTEEARARHRRAVAAGSAVEQADYLEVVERAFASLGDDQLARFRASTA
jgi:hypothetical protein